MLDWYRTTVDLVGALAWPSTVGVLLAILLFKFRDEISTLLQRDIQAETPFGKLAFNQQQSEPLQQQAEAEEAPAEEVPATTTATTTAATPVDAESAWRQLYSFEFAYRIIYGTQLALLKHLNAVPRASADDLDWFYQQHLTFARAQFPNWNLPRSDYLQFLVNQWLVTVTDDQYAISPHGVEFLVYLTRQKIADNVKPF
jgi:hypothetical protein